MKKCTYGGGGSPEIRQATYNPQNLKRLSKPIINKDKKSNLYGKTKKQSMQHYTGYPTNLLEFSSATQNSNKNHPTEKPVDLLEYLIKTYSNPGNVILDNCMGAGSTGIACVNTGRDFIGYELDEGFYNTAVKRIERTKNERQVI